MDSENQIEQPATDSNGAEQPAVVGETPMVTLSDGTQVSQEELVKGYMRQQDYTRKTQEISSQKKELELSDEDLEAIKLIKERGGFVTKDEIESLKSEQSDKEDRNEFSNKYAVSESQAKIIETLKQANPGKTREQIAQEYGIINELQVNRTKGAFIKGSSLGLPAKKEEIKVDVTKAGYVPTEQWKKSLAGIKF